MRDEERAQIDNVLRLLHDVFDDDLVGAYLLGSAALGGLQARSDLDILVVTRRRTTRGERGALVSELLTISMDPRPLEVTIVVEDEMRPWRYPPRMDFQYGEWWRDEFERGELEPWPSETNADLASLVHMVRLADAPLVGPSPREILDPVPRGDLVAALTSGIEGWIDDIEWDTVNVVLALARIWNGIETDDVLSKDAAATWALARLPEQHRPVLAEARAIYLGEQMEESPRFRKEARAYAEHMVATIDATQQTS